MPQLFKNNAFSTLGASLTNVATTLVVTTSHGDRFPAVTAPDFMLLTLQDASNNIEIVKVTARTSGADSMTITRAQEGTTARAWNLGDVVELRVTAGALNPLSLMEGAATAAALRAAIGLGNVDNTSDANKPVSTAQQTALDAKTTGPASSTDNTIPRFDGTTGKLLQGSSLVIDDGNNLGLNVTPAARLDVSGNQASNIVAMAALDVNCSAGNYFTKTIAGNSTFTFSNAPASRAFAFTLELTHTSGTVTWPAAVQWPGGTAPTLTTGKTHIFVFLTDDGGARWRGVANTNYTT